MKKSSRKRFLGQHFLIDQRALGRIISAARISKNETVCECGTGTGILTVELCKKAGHVVSFELDIEIFKRAQSALGSFSNLQLVNVDLFQTKCVFFDLFVSNLPYSRSRDAFQWLSTQRFERGVVTVQREFSEKLLAKPGDKNYRAISVLAQYCFRMEKVFELGRKSFSPMPAVESVLMKIVPIRAVKRETVQNLNLMFSQRNRRATTVAKRIGLTNNFDGNVRLDEMDVTTIMQMAERVRKDILSSR